ncbi:MAG: hypothetical protein WAT91_14045, partial [Saprospiraceae bacterium]
YHEKCKNRKPFLYHFIFFSKVKYAFTLVLYHRDEQEVYEVEVQKSKFLNLMWCNTGVYM